MRPSVVGVNKSGRPVVYHPPPPLLLPSGQQRPPLLLPSNQLLQLNPTMGRKRSRQNKNGQSRDRNSSYSSNDRMSVNGQTSRKRKAGRSGDSGRQKKERGDGPSQVVKRNERESGETHISERTTRNNLPLDRNSERKKKDKLPGIRNRRSSGENILN